MLLHASHTRTHMQVGIRLKSNPPQGRAFADDKGRGGGGGHRSARVHASPGGAETGASQSHRGNSWLLHVDVYGAYKDYEN